MRHAIFLFQRRVGLILDVSYLCRTNPAVGLHSTKAKSSLFGVSVGRNRIAIRQEWAGLDWNSRSGLGGSDSKLGVWALLTD